MSADIKDEQVSTDTAGTVRERVAGEVRAELARKRLSGRELSRRTGKSQPYWGRRISGDVAFDVDDLATVASILDVPVTDLFRGVAVVNSYYDGSPGQVPAPRPHSCEVCGRVTYGAAVCPLCRRVVRGAWELAA